MMIFRSREMMKTDKQMPMMIRARGKGAGYSVLSSSEGPAASPNTSRFSSGRTPGWGAKPENSEMAESRESTRCSFCAFSHPWEETDRCRPLDALGGKATCS